MTYLPASAPYVLAAALLFLGEGLQVALLTGAAFGIGRFAMPLFGSSAMTVTPGTACSREGNGP